MKMGLILTKYALLFYEFCLFLLATINTSYQILKFSLSSSVFMKGIKRSHLIPIVAYFIVLSVHAYTYSCKQDSQTTSQLDGLEQTINIIPFKQWRLR
jgi:hypothetical protein